MVASVLASAAVAVAWLGAQRRLVAHCRAVRRLRRSWRLQGAAAVWAGGSSDMVPGGGVRAHDGGGGRPAGRPTVAMKTWFEGAAVRGWGAGDRDDGLALGGMHSSWEVGSGRSDT